MKEKTCCFTGHRFYPKEEEQDIRRNLEREIEALVRQGVCYFGCGGALGFDTIAALTVLEMRERFPEIRLILVLPCLNQTRGWQPKDMETYWHIQSRADKVVYTSKGYYAGCMQVRNRHMVDNSGFCICYLRKNTGGTKYTVEYAQKKGRTIVYI